MARGFQPAAPRSRATPAAPLLRAPTGKTHALDSTGEPLFLEELVQVGYSFGYRKAHEYHFLHERGWQNRIQKLEPTAGFEPATRYLQIRT